MQFKIDPSLEGLWGAPGATTTWSHVRNWPLALPNVLYSSLFLLLFPLLFTSNIIREIKTKNCMNYRAKRQKRRKLYFFENRSRNSVDLWKKGGRLILSRVDPYVPSIKLWLLWEMNSNILLCSSFTLASAIPLAFTATLTGARPIKIPRWRRASPEKKGQSCRKKLLLEVALKDIYFGVASSL